MGNLVKQITLRQELPTLSRHQRKKLAPFLPAKVKSPGVHPSHAITRNPILASSPHPAPQGPHPARVVSKKKAEWGTKTFVSFRK